MLNVLVVDDSIAVRKVAERLLTEAGLGVTLAANGEEALAYLAKETPDLVVSDVIMPDKSGYEVCAFVRARKALANTPVLLISGIVNDEVMKQAESCHADEVLKKPFLGTSLRDCVLMLLAKRQGAAAPAEMSIEKAIESDEPIQRVRVSDEQLATYRQAVARLTPLEEELRVERDRATHSAQRVSQLEGQLGSSVKELELILTRERAQAAQLMKKRADADRAVARVQELESLLKTERERTVEAKKQASEAESLGGLAQELETALQKEREGSAQQATRLAELQKNASRVQELEAALHAERHAATQLVQQMTAMETSLTRTQESTAGRASASDVTRSVAEREQVAARVSTLEQALTAEQQKSKGLAARLSEAERASKKPPESAPLLSTEREHYSLLVKRASETEQAAEETTKRFEEIVTKLGKIAGLASQVGSGK